MRSVLPSRSSRSSRPEPGRRIPGELSSPLLATRGSRVTEEGLGTMVAEAIASWPELHVRRDTGHDLSTQESAILAEGRFTRRGARRSGNDPVALGVAEHAALLETALSVAEAAERLGVTEGRIRQRLSERPSTLWGVRVGHGWRLPASQFDARATIPGLEVLLVSLPEDLSPIAFHRWFTTPSTDLATTEGGTETLSPRDWLRLGRNPSVAAGLLAGL
jgi:excisionase family DNA binding protein